MRYCFPQAAESQTMLPLDTKLSKLLFVRCLQNLQDGVSVAHSINSEADVCIQQLMGICLRYLLSASSYIMINFHLDLNTLHGNTHTDLIQIPKRLCESIVS
jgi:hypothetical protein